MKKWLGVFELISGWQRLGEAEDKIYIRMLEGPLAYRDLRISAEPMVTEFKSLIQLIAVDNHGQTQSIYLPVNPAVLQWCQWRAKGKSLEGYPYTIFNRTQSLKPNQNQSLS